MRASLRLFTLTIGLLLLALKGGVASAADGPAGHTYCAEENGTFALTGICDVAYGANGNFSYKYSQTGTVAFDNNNFGDPCYGVVKQGYYRKVTEITISCDNGYELHVNGALIGNGSDWRNAQKYAFSLVPGKNVIAVKGADVDGVAALLADMTVNGQKGATGMAGWKVSLNPPANWTDVALDDSSWVAATEYGAYGVAPWYRNVANMPAGTSARWIWSSNNDADNEVYFRFVINNDSSVIAAPSNVTFPLIADRTVILAWQAPAEANAFGYYEVYRDGVYVGVMATPQYRDTNLTPATPYSYTVRSVNAFGGTSAFTPTAVATTLASTTGTGTGLLAKLYDEIDFSVRKVVRVDPQVNFDWGTGAPAAEVGADTFSVRWEGQIQAQYTEVYTFYTVSDDGIRLWVNGQMVVNNWTNHAATENSGQIALQAGQKYDIRMDYFENGGYAVAKLLWESLSQPKEVVATSQLYPAQFLASTEIQLLTCVASLVSPVWVEGKCSEDAVEVRFSVNGGEENAAVALSSERWYADTACASGLPLGIPLDKDNPTVLSVSASDGTASQPTQYSLVWMPTALTGKSWSDDEILIRKGDSLLLTATGAGAVLTIDADGDGDVDFTGAPGDKVSFRYDLPGIYNAEAWIDGSSVGSLQVIAAHVDLRKPIACQVGYQREKAVWVAPAPAAEKVLFSSADLTSLAVSVKALVAAQDGQTATLYLKPLKRGTPVLVVRLPGEAGPVVTTAEVDEFQLEFSNVTLLIPDQATGCADADMYMTPLVRDLEVRFNMFASTCTFPGGIKSFSASTNDFVLEAGTVETSGVYRYTIEIPEDEDRACYNVTVYQDGKQVSFKE